MRKNIAGAVLVLVAVLGVSACGSGHAVREPKTTTVSPTDKRKVAAVSFALPSAANLVIVPTQRGAGNEEFGTFTASGTVYIEASCKGKGALELVGISTEGPCDGSPVGITIPYKSGHSVRLAVRVQPGTTWRLAVGERVPGASLVLVHRSGVGNKSFGTFQLRGTVTIATTCKGRGPMDASFRSTSSKTIPGVGTVCPQTPGNSASFPVPAAVSGAVISVEAGPKVRWTITVSETK